MCGPLVMVAAHRLGRRGPQASLLHSTWNLTGPGIEPLSSALEGGFLSSMPSGKSKTIELLKITRVPHTHFFKRGKHNAHFIVEKTDIQRK